MRPTLGKSFHFLITLRQQIFTPRQQILVSLSKEVSHSRSLWRLMVGGYFSFARNVQVKEIVESSAPRPTNFPPASVVFALFVILLVFGSTIYVLGFYVK